MVTVVTLSERVEFVHNVNGSLVMRYYVHVHDGCIVVVLVSNPCQLCC